jgi:CRP-like cAMP-binding protein
METLEPIISQHPFFAGLDKAHLELVVGCASNVRFDPGTVIFREGEEADRFFILRSGLVAVEVNVPGRGPVRIQTLGDGDVLGWSWLFPPFKWHFGAQAVELTRAIALDGQCLRTKCENDHSLGYRLLLKFAGVMEDRLAAMRMQLLDLYRES